MIMSMKKKCLLLLLPLLLAGCSEKGLEPFENNVDGSLSIMTPTGAPAVVLSSFINDPKFQPSNTAPSIIAQMVQEKVDIAVLPTNAGIQQINKGLNYQIAATITFGNMFIVSNGTDDDGVLDATDNIYLFGKGSVPHKTFQAIYNINVPDEKIKGNSGDIKNMIELNQEAYEYALIAEPDLTSLQSKGTPITVFANIQNEYKNKFNGQEIFQASVFVKKGLNADTVKSYLDAFKRYSTRLLEHPETLKDVLAKDPTAESTLVININDAIASISNGNRLGVGYKNAFEHKSEIDTFLSVFGLPATNEEIYFK